MSTEKLVAVLLAICRRAMAGAAPDSGSKSASGMRMRADVLHAVGTVHGAEGGA